MPERSMEFGTPRSPRKGASANITPPASYDTLHYIYRQSYMGSLRDLPSSDPEVPELVGKLLKSSFQIRVELSVTPRGC